jgi:hypothetical protein
VAEVVAVVVAVVVAEVVEAVVAAETVSPKVVSAVGDAILLPHGGARSPRSLDRHVLPRRPVCERVGPRSRPTQPPPCRWA